MACGTPMVSFKVGGVPDLVRPGITGYLAEPENVEDFGMVSFSSLKMNLTQLYESTVPRDCRKKYSLGYMFNAM